MNVTSATNLQWVSQNTINIDATFDKYGGEVLPYTVTLATDAALFARIVAGEFGAIAAIPTKSLTAVKSEKLLSLQKSLYAAEYASVIVQGRPFPATEEFQAKISRALNYIGRGKPLDLSNAWRDGNAQPVVMSTVLLGQIEDAITAQGVAAWVRYWQRYDAVNAATTVEIVNSIVW